jgi:Fe2+ or Zn2+ uptake regulation protein
MTIVEIIKKTGLKTTPQRKMVYELMTALRHGSIDEIIAGVQQQNPEITISTVYRILDSFCEVGLLSKLKHPNGKWFFDITTSDHHHVFTNIGIIDYTDPELTELIKNRLQDTTLFKHLDIEKISIQIITNNKK